MSIYGEPSEPSYYTRIGFDAATAKQMADDNQRQQDRADDYGLWCAAEYQRKVREWRRQGLIK